MEEDDLHNKPKADPNGDLDSEITFSHKDNSRILSHENNPMAIKVQCDDMKIKRVLICPINFVDVQYLDVFDRLKLDSNNF